MSSSRPRLNASDRNYGAVCTIRTTERKKLHFVRLPSSRTSRRRPTGGARQLPNIAGRLCTAVECIVTVVTRFWRAGFLLAPLVFVVVVVPATLFVSRVFPRQSDSRSTTGRAPLLDLRLLRRSRWPISGGNRRGNRHKRRSNWFRTVVGFSIVHVASNSREKNISRFDVIFSLNTSWFWSVSRLKTYTSDSTCRGAKPESFDDRRDTRDRQTDAYGNTN